jgi:hypothetical protein
MRPKAAALRARTPTDGNVRPCRLAARRSCAPSGAPLRHRHQAAPLAAVPLLLPAHRVSHIASQIASQTRPFSRGERRMNLLSAAENSLHVPACAADPLAERRRLPKRHAATAPGAAATGIC